MTRKLVALCVAAVAFVACTLTPAAASSRNTKGGVGFAQLGMQPGPTPEINFDPSRQLVTVRVSPAQLQGVKLPFPLRERLTVLENGVPASDVTVAVEHSPITLGVLVENGGHSHQVSSSVSSDAALLLRSLVDVIEPEDRLGVFTYDESVHTVVDFDAPQDQRKQVASDWPTPRFSETNFYDATVALLDRLAGMPGRKALLILSTGVDTFSQTSYAALLAKAEQAHTPIYVVDLGQRARGYLSTSSFGPLTRVDWTRCEQQLKRLSDVSGGRAYLEASGADTHAIFDDMVEDLRVRYVLSYKAASDIPGPRTVQVAIRDAAPPDARTIARTSRRPDRSNQIRVIAQATYTPDTMKAASSSFATGNSR
jgi:VWFA-related protein